MAYLKNENSEIIVDAILTDYGRQKLARSGELGITKFGLADDEVDYSLYNVTHPDGELYYDVAIREMPVLEALSKTDNVMKYKLYTTSTDTLGSFVYSINIPIVTAFVEGISTPGIVYNINPSLIPTPSNLNLVHYVATVTGNNNVNYISIKSSDEYYKNNETNAVLLERQNILSPYDDDASHKYAVGKSFVFIVNSLPRRTIVYNVSIESAGIASRRVDFTIRVNGTEASTATQV